MATQKSAELDFLEQFEDFVNATRKGKRTKQNGTKLLQGSVKKLEVTYKTLKDFSELKRFPLKISALKKANKRETQSQKAYWNRFHQKFSDYLYNDLDCYDNYTGSVMKDIRVFFNYLITEKNLSIGNYHKKFYVCKEDIEIVTLQPEQLNYLIYDKAFENALPSKLLQVKDIFVVGCTVALRYSDLINLKRSNLESCNGSWYLKVQSKKTKTYTRIKLPEYVVNIFSKYKKNGQRLLPYFNLFRLNIYLKQLVEQAGWTDERIKTRQKKGVAVVVFKNKKNKEHYRFFDHISSHTMRRTAITTMLRLQMPEHLVRKISGHAPNSKAFHRYVAISQNYLDAETDKIFEKLNSFSAKND